MGFSCKSWKAGEFIQVSLLSDQRREVRTLGISTFKFIRRRRAQKEPKIKWWVGTKKSREKCVLEVKETENSEKQGVVDSVNCNKEPARYGLKGCQWVSNYQSSVTLPGAMMELKASSGLRSKPKWWQRIQKSHNGEKKKTMMKDRKWTFFKPWLHSSNVYVLS